MKEYIAETGGRYTYSDDILNLQELALSLSSVFEGCTDFIISGCEPDGPRISPGYVWLGGKVRYFEGCADAVYPYYIYEVNRHESVVYAGDVDKLGRTCYLCAGGAEVPSTEDGVTGQLPRFIEMTAGYAPRFIDKFMGRYAVLLDTPFTRQTIKKDLVLTGSFSGEKEISSRTAVSVTGADGYQLKGIVRTDGNASVGAYLNGLLVNEIVFHTDGSVSFMKQGKEMARMTEQGLSCDTVSGKSVRAGSVILHGNHLYNADDASDEGSVTVNRYGLDGGGSRFRDFAVYDGKQGTLSLLHVIGKENLVRVNAAFSVRNAGAGMDLWNTAYTKDNPKLVGLLSWKDSNGAVLAHAGFDTADGFRFALKNLLDDIVLVPKGAVDIQGTLKINGKPSGEIYISIDDFNAAMKKKVDATDGKGLSTEDFTTELKRKLEAISTGTLEDGGDGYVTASGMRTALGMKLSANENLRDIMDKGAARDNLDVYSREEAGGVFLKISSGLGELVELTAEEIEGLPVEEITALKERKEAAVRATIKAEKAGTGELKLAKASNLSDVSDKAKARQNISVYSIAEVDRLLEGKLGTDSAYTGIVFTPEMRDKLLAIKDGSFAYTDASGSHAQVEGYLKTSQVEKELKKKAERLMEGYGTSEKSTIAANLGLYTRSESDGRFATLESLFQDYISYLARQGKTTEEAQKILRDKLDLLSKEEIVKDYLRKDGKLSDLVLATTESKRQACRTLGAAFADDYQPLMQDTGWLQMANSGLGTDTSGFFVRQIGNIVSIQGYVNTAKRDGSNEGGVVAVIPNKIQPPKYSVRCTAANWNDNHKYNRGTTFVIYGGSRHVQLFERGMYNVNVELNFTYFV